MKPRYLFLALLIFCTLPLSADISKPYTTYSEENGYTTIGFVNLDAPFEKAQDVILDFAGYENWLLDGLTRDDPEAKKLIVTLNRLEYDSEYSDLTVYFSFNIFFLKNKEYSLPFILKKLDDGSGVVLTADSDHWSSKFISKLVYTIKLDQMPSGLVLNYSGDCKLRGFADRCFNLRLYKKNIEWYIYKFASNFVNRLSD